MIQSASLYVSIGIGLFLCFTEVMLHLSNEYQTKKMISIYGMEKLGLYYPKSLYNAFVGYDYVYAPSFILYIIFPLLATMPYGLSYFSDRKSGYLKSIFLKTKRNHYLAAKYLVVYFSGFFTTFVILTGGLIFAACFFPALRPELVTSTFSPCEKTALWFSLFIEHPLEYTFLYIVVDAIFMGAIATVALVISVVAKNMLIVLAGAMFGYITIDIVANITDTMWISPLRWLMPSQLYCDADMGLMFMEFMVVMAITAILFWMREKDKDVF